jgi:CHASE3 domain sensor protein
MNQIREMMQEIENTIKEKLEQGDYISQQEAFHLRKEIERIRNLARQMHSDE